MKYLFLLLITPLFSFSQEAILAIRDHGQWTPTVNYANIANTVLPQTSSLNFDSSYIDFTSGTIQLIDFYSLGQRSDRLLYNIVGDTMYTQADIYTQVFLLMCETNECCLVCKKAQNGCSCYMGICDKNKCDERTYGISDIPGVGISNAIRSYLQ